MPGIWKTFVLRKSEENMMKKALSLILALAMALSLAACGGSKTEIFFYY